MKTIQIFLTVLLCFSLSAENLIQEKMEQAWEQLTQTLFCPRTNLIYDSISTPSGPERFEHLPAVDEIQRSLPNSLGWGTGMEDSMLNAGSAMDLCILRAKLEPGKRASARTFAASLLKGMELCATVHGKRGYVVRSVSHRDGKSCYPESSVDQFTFWVWGLWRYYRSDLSTPAEKEKIRILLTDLASLCEKELADNVALFNPAGEWSKMTILKKTPHHAAMRLPMFYAAAYDATGDVHWLKCYQKAFTEGRRRMETVKPNPWNAFSIPQHQCSMRLCYEVDTDPEHREFLRKQMRSVAGEAETILRKWGLAFLDGGSGRWDAPAISWRDPANSWELQTYRNGKSAVDSSGHIHLKPRPKKEFYEPFNRLRCAGNFTIGMLLSPDYTPSAEFFSRFESVVKKPEYRKHTSAGLVNILHAYYLVRQYKAGHGKENTPW